MVITDEEFRKIGGGQLGAIQFAMGAASTCWSDGDLATAGTFQSDRAAQIAADLDRYLTTGLGGQSGQQQPPE